MLIVSIIVPTYNRLERLKSVLAGLEAQDYPLSGFEVIVVADGCTDGTNHYLRSIETRLQLRPIIAENQGVATARNRGVAEASGPLVLFLDDDVVPAPHLVSAHVQTHEKVGAGIAALGPMLTPPGVRLRPWVLWEQLMLQKQYDDMATGRWQPTARQFYTGNTSLALDEIRAAGGFDPRFRRAEDVELAYRLAARGIGFVFNPRAVGYHHVDRSFGSWLAIPYAYGRSDVVFGRDLGQSWLLPRVAYEYRNDRHPLIRGLTSLCLGRPALSGAVTAGLRVAAQAGHRLGSQTVPRMAYSGIFNLRYYQGMADELGSRDAFFAGMARTELPPVPGVLEESRTFNWQAK